MNSHRNRRRYIALFANAITNLAVGTGYTWSVFAKPLSGEFGWSDTQISFVYTITCIAFPVGTIIGGQLQHRFRRQAILPVAALTAGVVTFLAGFTTVLPWLCLTYGAFGAACLGTIFSCTMSNVARLFPDNKGMAGGFSVAGYGLGAVVLAPAFQALIAATSPLTAFKCMGLWYVAVIGCCWAVLLKTTPPEAAPASAPAATPEAAPAPPPATSSDSGAIFKTPQLYLTILMVSIFAMSTFMIISQASVMAQTITGASAAAAAVIVSVISMGNTLGRFVWGWISDRLGRYNTILLLYIVMGVSLFILSRIPAGVPAFFAVPATTVGFCYGGLMGILPALSADTFGVGDVSRNYGLLILGCALGGMVGPPLAAAFADAGSGPFVYAVPFLLAACLCIPGIALVFIVKKLLRRG